MVTQTQTRPGLLTEAPVRHTEISWDEKSINTKNPYITKLVNQVSKPHKAILIKGGKNRAILISEDEWRSIQETLYLMSIPGMHESLIEGMSMPVSEMSTTLEW